MSILDEIVEKRRNDIQALGYTLGFEIPQKRLRPVTPFLESKGTILEVKRASPSKGDIAPNLDAAATALEYARAGTAAISVLTETHYFKGTLKDLMDVCRTMDEYAEANPGSKKPAVLRKDFLIDEQEIDVAYNCGADAVLLISRILEKDKMVSMAKKCQELGITALIELRKKEDLEKLAAVCSCVDSRYFVCGVNARDLSDFSIDLLTPAGMQECIKQIAGNDARVIFESGIRTTTAASFASSMDFTGMLLGEAAARNPEEAKNLVTAFVNTGVTANGSFWLNHSRLVQEKSENQNKRPFVKICGITNSDDALEAAKLGADFLGFIFCGASPRNVESQKVVQIAKAVRQEFKTVRLVAVVVDLTSPEAKAALELVKNGILDAIQLHGMEQQVCQGEMENSVAHYTAVNISSEQDLQKIDSLRLLGEPRILIDAKVGNLIGGTGTSIQSSLVQKVSKKTKLWLAGGITPETVADVVNQYMPELIDVSSGVELSPGKKDHKKLQRLFSALEKSWRK